MVETGAPWQLECEKVEERCGYLLTSGIWSDCTFMVGSETNQEVIQAHKLILAMASPVFEAMFYGLLSERNDPIVHIPDISPEAFRALLQYIYTGNISIDSFDMACDLWFGADKYMLPHLVTLCKKYINSVLGPGNACRAYEFARFFDDKTLMDESIKIISTNTKEVLNDSSFVDLELNTVIAVCSLDHLTVDSELDLFYAVARYAEEEKRRQGEISPPVDGGPSEELSAKVLLPSAGNSFQTSPAVELHSKSPTEMVTFKPTANKDNLKEEEPSIHTALQKIRFLSLSAQEFAEGPADSNLLTKDESLAIFMNIASTDSTMPMPTGFSKCRERRQLRNESKEKWNIITALTCEDPRSLQVKEAARAAGSVMFTPLDIQPALDKGILDALVPALTWGDDECRLHAARAISRLCHFGSPAQRRVLAASDALQPYCRLLAAGRRTCGTVLRGLSDMLKKVKQNTNVELLQKLREIGVPQLLINVQEVGDESNRQRAVDLLQSYFSGGQ